MTMQHLTDTSDAWDREGERADALADAITTEAERIVRDKVALTEVVAGWLIESDTDIAELLAMLVASRLPHGVSCPLPSWVHPHLELALRQLETNIAAEIDKEARFIIEGDKP
jgi:hypothetical protein